MATITVRVVKSFEYHNYRTLVFPNLDLETLTLDGLRSLVHQKIINTPNLRTLLEKNLPQLDTIKLYYQPFGAKANNPMINMGGDETLIYKDYHKPLEQLGFKHETEVSYFNRADYENYRLNPVQKW